MGTVTILPETTENPYELMGRMAGICYGTNIEDAKKNIKRGKQCVEDGHGRVLEFPQIYMRLDGYSARVVRELYTQIGGSPTRLQASTRYIDYTDFEYIVPPKIAKDKDTKQLYEDTMASISKAADFLINRCEVPKEDVANLLPLGMTTVVSCRYNARCLMDMSRNRLCSRAYWEYRQLMKDIISALSEYSEEWKELAAQIFKCKCDVTGYCMEHQCCGKYPQKSKNDH